MVNNFVTKDSGERESFAMTGAQRDSRTGKGRFDLIPGDALTRLAQLYERGAAKYEARNWEKGMPMSRMIDSMLRHAFQASAGDADEDHLAAVIFNAMGVMAYQERIKRGLLPAELDDLPKPVDGIDRNHFGAGMRHHTAARKGEDGGWHYVSMSRQGGYPLGYCAEHEPHATEIQARECYSQYQRDNIRRLDDNMADWSGCRVCDAPTKNVVDIRYEGFRSAPLCDEHRTQEHAIKVLGLDQPAGDAWVS